MDISALEIVIAVGALLLAGLAKGISGMGVPVIATPILAVLFDLQTAIAVTITATLVTDAIMLARLPKNWSLLKQAGILMLFGICGIIIGSIVLVQVNQLILSGILGLVILVFVATSVFSLLPAIRRHALLDSVVGLGGGMLQGASGASGPIISMYFADETGANRVSVFDQLLLPHRRYYPMCEHLSVGTVQRTDPVLLAVGTDSYSSGAGSGDDAAKANIGSLFPQRSADSDDRECAGAAGKSRWIALTAENAKRGETEWFRPFSCRPKKPVD